MLTAANGARDGASKTVIVLTDGQSTNTRATALQVATCGMMMIAMTKMMSSGGGDNDDSSLSSLSEAPCSSVSSSLSS